MLHKTDILVIGTGIAGLSYALKVAEKKKVVILTKAEAEDTSTSLAQGGIAAVMYNPDTYDKHIADTMKAGDDLSDPEIVKITIEESTERVKELIAWGWISIKMPAENTTSQKRVDTRSSGFCTTKMPLD